MSESTLIEVPDQDERTQVAYLERMAGEIGDAHRGALNAMARGLVLRGGVPPLDELVKALAEGSSPAAVEEALSELERRRLIRLDRTANRVAAMLGFISLEGTPHRGHLASGVDVFTFGGLDLLTLRSVTLRDVEAFTVCGHSGAELRLRIEQGQIVDANVNGIAGFLANWDGRAPLEEVAKRSPLFASDEDLAAWVAAHPNVKGTELPADLLLWLGLSACEELGAARFALVGRADGD